MRCVQLRHARVSSSPLPCGLGLPRSVCGISLQPPSRNAACDRNTNPQRKAGHVTVIDADAECVTLINTFIVQPEKQDELVDVLDQATERVMRDRPGFISANIHRSLDGKRVVNYAQWRCKADLDATYAEPACREHMAKAAGLAEWFEPVLYTVSSVHERWSTATLPYSPDIFVSL